jgi:protein required for attachment to host cells/ribosome-associated translation inhibitor RaiA
MTAKPTWIVTMDGAQARFFALRRSVDGQIFEETAKPLAARHERPARAGKPGRAFASAGGGVRHAVEPRTDHYKLETTNFAREVAGTLDAAVADRRFSQLVIVAPPRNLAELRALLTARVRETLAHEVPKNLCKLGTDALWEKLSAILLKAARPMNGSGARVATNMNGNLPVSVVFRNMDASPSVQASALKFAAKLGRKFERIINCRVTVEAPHHEHRKVKLFQVAIDLKLPGHEIASKSSGERADVTTALREAFESATRQVQDHVHRMKGTTLRARRQTSPRTRGIGLV